MKVFGSSAVIGTSCKKSVGQTYIEAILDTINDRNLTISSSDFSGILGRKAIFYAQTGRALLKKVKNSS